jgi:hypothetical protein
MINDHTELKKALTDPFWVRDGIGSPEVFRLRVALIVGDFFLVLTLRPVPANKKTRLGARFELQNQKQLEIHRDCGIYCI